MKQTTATDGTNLGVAGLILGIISIPFALMGCTFLIGLILGVVGIVLSASAYNQAQKAKAQTGLIVAALIISILGTCFALVRLTNTASKTASHVNKWKNAIEQIDDLSDEVEDDFEYAFEKGFEEEFGETIEESIDYFEEEMNKLEQELEKAGEEIEKAFNDLPDDEKARRLGRATGRALREFLEELSDSTRVN